jgi:acylphosphatase
VFFRASTQERAQALGLTGWVRNLSDGRVEALAEGGEDAIAEFVQWCRGGPRLARVDDLQVEHASATGEFSGFQVRR